MQGVEAVRQEGEAAAEEAGVVAEAVRAGQRACSGDKGHHGEDQEEVASVRNFILFQLIGLNTIHE